MRFKKGDLVYVRTRSVSEPLDGAYILQKATRFSNFPYRVFHNGKSRLLMESEVFQITYQLPPTKAPDSPPSETLDTNTKDVES